MKNVIFADNFIYINENLVLITFRIIYIELNFDAKHDFFYFQEKTASDVFLPIIIFNLFK